MVIFAMIALSLNAHAEDNRDCIYGTLYTDDHIAIAYNHYKKGFESVVVICPGFYNSMKNRWMQAAVDLVLSQHDVVIFDFRGHGKSGGKYSWTANEHLDVNAALDYAKSQGYKRIGILAFSLAAASSINAVSQREDVDSMILISCPASLRGINFNFWEPGMLSDLKDNIDCKWEGKGARVTNIFTSKPGLRPINTISAIKHTPIFFIHGDSDWIIKDYHSKRLYEAARTQKRIEIIENGLHAERLIQFHPDKMRKLILDWFRETLNKDNANAKEESGHN